MSAFVTIKQIAEALGVHVSSAKRQATKGNWPYLEETCVGGWRRLYSIKQLPLQIQLALAGERIRPTGGLRRKKKSYKAVLSRADLRAAAAALSGAAEHQAMMARQLQELAEALLAVGKEDGHA